jgi:hypothetical protein
MPSRIATWIAGVATLAGCSLVSGPAYAQVPAKEKTTKQWRTPWGDPDLQGSWSNATTTPLERPAKYAGREFMTAEERAAQDKQTEIGRDKRAAPGTPEDVAGAYNAGWWEWGHTDGRTSLIYDPPDGRMVLTMARRIWITIRGASFARRCRVFRRGTTTIMRSCRRREP